MASSPASLSLSRSDAHARSVDSPTHTHSLSLFGKLTRAACILLSPARSEACARILLPADSRHSLTYTHAHIRHIFGKLTRAACRRHHLQEERVQGQMAVPDPCYRRYISSIVREILTAATRHEYQEDRSAAHPLGTRRTEGGSRMFGDVHHQSGVSGSVLPQIASCGYVRRDALARWRSAPLLLPLPACCCPCPPAVALAHPRGARRIQLPASAAAM